jgi:hypothetical protein
MSDPAALLILFALPLFPLCLALALRTPEPYCVKCYRTECPAARDLVDCDDEAEDDLD